MKERRIIPRLDIINGRVVKGMNFILLVDLGDPVEIAKAYEAQNADEVLFHYVTACIEEKQKMYDLVERAVKEISIPLSVSGGIHTAEDFGGMLAVGASKVAINSAAVANPQFITEVSKKFGKKQVMVAIDSKRIEGHYRVVIKGRSEDKWLELMQWVKKCEELGAGEILLTSMDGEGMQKGYDIEMTKAVCHAVKTPVIASGGCGKTEDVINVFKKTGCDAALLASLLHYKKLAIHEIKAEMEKKDMI